MLFAKISPAASVVRQNGPFNTSTETAEWMAASAHNYTLGAKQVRFDVKFGSVTLEEGVVTDFRQLTDTEFVLTGADLDAWGADDSYVLGKIADSLNIEILETAEGQGRFGRLF